MNISVLPTYQAPATPPVPKVTFWPAESVSVQTAYMS